MGGWIKFDNPLRRFRNQGDCIQFVNAEQIVRLTLTNLMQSTFGAITNRGAALKFNHERGRFTLRILLRGED